MRFSQLDRIVSLEKGKSITGVKCLSLSEAYLKDHFPRFPVMPGVLMLESMFQASMWLVRASTDFQFAMCVLRETKSLKFQGFVQPGDSLTVDAEIKKCEGDVYNLKVSGSVSSRVCTSGRLVVETFNGSDRDDNVDPAIDRYMNFKFRTSFRRLCNQLDPLDLSEVNPEPLVSS